MDLKTGIVCSLPVVLLICAACSEAFALRKPESEELISALARLDRALGEMISKSDERRRDVLSDVSKRNEDGAVPYKRNEDGSIPYKRNEASPMRHFSIETRGESLDRVLRYLLDMEDRLHERNVEKRDHE